MDTVEIILYSVILLASGTLAGMLIFMGIDGDFKRFKKK